MLNKSMVIAALKFGLPLVVVLLIQISVNAQGYTQNEQNCFDLVQGKVAYNKAGNKNWKDTNVRLLCKGTTYPARTIDCFNLSITNYNDFSRGIKDCSQTALNNPVIDSAKDATQYEQDCFNMIQGKVAYDKAGNKNWSEANLSRLCKNTVSAVRTIDCFNLRLVNYGNYSRGIDECSAELNGKWTAYSDDGTLSGGHWEIAGLGGINFRTSAGKAAFNGQRSGNKITTTFQDYFRNVMTGTVSKNGTRIDWSTKMIWIKDDGKPPAASVPLIP